MKQIIHSLYLMLPAILLAAYILMLAVSVSMIRRGTFNKHSKGIKSLEIISWSIFLLTTSIIILYSKAN